LPEINKLCAEAGPLTFKLVPMEVIPPMYWLSVVVAFPATEKFPPSVTNPYQRPRVDYVWY